MILPQVHLRNVSSNQTPPINGVCLISTKLSQKAFPPFVPLSSSSLLEDGLYLKRLDLDLIHSFIQIQPPLPLQSLNLLHRTMNEIDHPSIIP